jgi:DNA-binding CsgD family transcriptional regulator/tetratricopeptide (TPR) repeat protein
MRSSPVLFGRDELLALGRRRLEQARNGDGELLFLAGEAGIGKTRLLEALAREAAAEGSRVFGAAVFPGDLELSGGLLLDLGHQLGRSAVPGVSELGAAVTAALTQGAAGSGEAHRRRRLMVLSIVDRLAEVAAGGPTVFALEDLHWSDDLTLEVLAQLARRLRALPLLVIATYRSDELYPRVPMRQWRARLLSQRLAEEAPLRRLTFDEIQSMATLLLGGSTLAPRDLVEVLHERSDGIPLHVEELVGAAAGGLTAPELHTVPDTLREAILQRRAALSDASAAVAGAAAVIGRSFDLDLVAAVADQPLATVARGVEELIERAFVAAAADGWYDFRHALIRDALEGAVPLDLRRELHARVAAVAVQRPDLGGAAYRSAHYEAAGATEAAYEHAVIAAERASSLSNHREALNLFRRAVRCAPAALPERRLATLLVARAAEAAATDDNEAAAADYLRAYELLTAGGDAAAAATLLPRLVAVRHLLGDGLDARIRLLEDGQAALSSANLPEQATAQVRGRLAAAFSAAYMLERRLDESIGHGDRALALAVEAGDEASELNVLATLGAVLVFAGRVDEGWPMLQDAVRRARADRQEAEAARAYRMLGTSASVLVEYERAEQWLREGIEYAERAELWNDRHYMAAHLGHVLWATGRWDEASEVAEHAIADGRGGLTTSITALHVRGYLALGRGNLDAASRALGQARDIGARMGELQRLSPALWGLAELALAERRWADAVALCRAGHQASAAVRDAAYLYPFLVTGTRALLELGDPVAAAAWVDDVGTALLDRAIPGTLPAIDHARGLLQLAAGSTGLARTSLAAAREAWQSRGRAWEGSWVTLDLARCAYRSNRAAEAATLLAETGAAGVEMGAAPVVGAAAALAALVRGHGAAGLSGSTGSTGSAGSSWAPLTTREFEVAQRVCAGRTNREIAAELHIAARTAATHVEHILTKLGVQRRAEIAAWVVGVRSG